MPQGSPKPPGSGRRGLEISTTAPTSSSMQDGGHPPLGSETSHRCGAGSFAGQQGVLACLAQTVVRNNDGDVLAPIDSVMGSRQRARRSARRRPPPVSLRSTGLKGREHDVVAWERADPSQLDEGVAHEPGGLGPCLNDFGGMPGRLGLAAIASKRYL